MAEYTDDPDRVFWFLQITDTHIDNFLYGSEVEQMELALGAVFDTIQPFFVVNTGDLTDHTSGPLGIDYLAHPNEEEWTLYRSITDAAGMDSSVYFDIPGNHDYYGGDGTLFLDHSVQGVATGTVQPDWTLDLPWGMYHFISGATPHNDDPPLPWPFDNKAFSDAELMEFEANLLAHTDARLSFAFGHHDFETCLRGADFRNHLLDYGVAHYGHGHEHDLGTRQGSGIYRFRCSAMGQAGSRNICIWAVDADAVAWGVTDATNPWPAAVITAPVDARLGPGDGVDNIYAPPVPNGCTEAPVRAMAWDVGGVSEVFFQVDAGSLNAMTENPSTPDQWLGVFDATPLDAGLHELQIHISGDEWRHVQAQFLVEDGPCDFVPPPADEDEPEPVDEAEDLEPVPETAHDAYEDMETDAGDPDVEKEAGDVGATGGGCACSLVI